MRLSIPAQPAETRVAADPDTVRDLVGLGIEVLVTTGVGDACRHRDADYADAGATIVNDETAWSDADVVCVVTAPSAGDVRRLREGSVLIGQLAPGRDLEMVRALRERRVTSYSLELIPRISRAQAMDSLSSQAGLAGYRAAIMSAALLDKHLPLSMTAAGTLRPALIIVLGAGVAGLQAIAPARRLGAVVRANDVRAAAKGEVASLGG
jgi:NAD(P) transhydrogenase subunit alpha